MNTYSFLYQENCNMCGESTQDVKVLGMRLNKSQGRHPREKTGVGVTICQCKSCGLSFAHPMPIPGSIEDHYGIEPGSYWTDEQFSDDASQTRIRINELKTKIDFKSGMTALDVGAGIGKTMVALKEGGFDVYGIEPGSSFRQYAIEKNGVPADRLQLASIETAEFEPGTFNLITFGAVLEHFYDPSASLTKAVGWLKPGGVIEIDVPSSNYLMESLINTYFRLKGTNYVTNLSPMHGPYHLYAFTKNSFDRHSGSAGYEVEEVRYYVSPIRYAPNFLKPLLRLYMTKKKRGQQLGVYLRKPSI